MSSPATITIHFDEAALAELDTLKQEVRDAATRGDDFEVVRERAAQRVGDIVERAMRAGKNGHR